MLIKTLMVGPVGTNCCVVTDEDTLECAVIDPGDSSNMILDYLESNKLTCRYIFITHGHFDHIMALDEVQRGTGATVCVNERDVGMKTFGMASFTPPEGTVCYSEGDTFKVGSLEFRVMETPGHSPGSVTLICGDALFTGDTLFRDSCGRTDLPGGDMDTLLGSIRRICELPGDYEVYPGHMDSTTLERERRFNYYARLACEK